MPRSQLATRWAGLKPPVGTPLDAAHPLRAGLVAAYGLNEGGGTSVSDLCANQSGTLTNGPTWTAASGPPAGPALSCASASSQYVLLPTANLPGAGSAASIAAGLIPTSTSADAKLVARWDDAGGGTYDWLLQLSGSGHNQPNLVGIAGSTAYNTIATTASTVAAGSAAHLVGTFTGAASGVVLYLNGTARATTTSTFGSAVHGARCTLGVGLNGAAVTGAFNGTILYCYIWSRVLTADEVTQLYLNPLCLYQPLRRVFAVRPEPWPIGYGPPGGPSNANAVYRM